MLSHELKQFKIDGEKTIIQNPSEAQRKEHEKCTFETYEVYAIDVIVSTGEGVVSNPSIDTTSPLICSMIKNTRLRLTLLECGVCCESDLFARRFFILKCGTCRHQVPAGCCPKIARLWDLRTPNLSWILDHRSQSIIANIIRIRCRDARRTPRSPFTRSPRRTTCSRWRRPVLCWQRWKPSTETCHSTSAASRRRPRPAWELLSASATRWLSPSKCCTRSHVSVMHIIINPIPYYASWQNLIPDLVHLRVLSAARHFARTNSRHCRLQQLPQCGLCLNMALSQSYPIY